MRRRGSPLVRPTRLTWCGRNSENWLPEERHDLDHGGVTGGDRPTVDGGELDGAHGGTRHVLAGHGDERPDLEAVGAGEGGEHRRQPLVHLAGAQLRVAAGGASMAGLAARPPAAARASSWVACWLVGASASRRLDAPHLDPVVALADAGDLAGAADGAGEPRRNAGISQRGVETM